MPALYAARVQQNPKRNSHVVEHRRRTSTLPFAFATLRNMVSGSDSFVFTSESHTLAHAGEKEATGGRYSLGHLAALSGAHPTCNPSAPLPQYLSRVTSLPAIPPYRYRVIYESFIMAQHGTRVHLPP